MCFCLFVILGKLFFECLIAWSQGNPSHYTEGTRRKMIFYQSTMHEIMMKDYHFLITLRVPWPSIYLMRTNVLYTTSACKIWLTSQFHYPIRGHHWGVRKMLVKFEVPALLESIRERKGYQNTHPCHRPGGTLYPLEKSAKKRPRWEEYSEIPISIGKLYLTLIHWEK